MNGTVEFQISRAEEIVLQKYQWFALALIQMFQTGVTHLPSQASEVVNQIDEHTLLSHPEALVMSGLVSKLITLQVEEGRKHKQLRNAITITEQPPSASQVSQ